MPRYTLAFLIGAAAGLRSMTAPAAVSWAARFGWLRPVNGPPAFLRFVAAPYILSVLAIGELIGDKLPQMPSRKSLAPFAARIGTGMLSGAALVRRGDTAAGIVAGALGGVSGTLAGSELRTRLVKANGGKDLPVALLEDGVAISAAFWAASRAR